MASILPPFEYDIFISYRHNDNRSGWVREFVHALKEELAATLKESVSVYFDENPHDGLLETHDVDDSLRDKLKCVIFIPILSQTYCDPKSFAWQNEFLVFKKTAAEDSVGLKIKLPNGNTTSRILPIRIHDLDVDDKTLLENELGTILRCIDFIFKSPGVNRPLRAHEEHSHDNLNKTFYRDQVNKVANSVKEIVAGLKGVTSKEVQNRQAYNVPPVGSSRKRLAVIGGGILFCAIAAFLIYNFLQPKPSLMESSIAVLAFEDISENHDQEYFSDGISEEIINALVKIDGLKVPSRTSSFWFKGKGMELMEIGKRLNVALILEGSVRKSGDNLRITAQLIDASNGFHVWSETYNHKTKDIFKAQDEVTRGIIRQLQKRVGIAGTLAARKLPTENLEAYDLYLKGHKYFLMKGKHVIKARELLQEAVRLDPNFAMAHAALAEACAVMDLGMGDPKQALTSAYRAMELDSTISSAYAVIAWIKGVPEFKGDIETFDADIYSNFQRAIRLDPQNSTAYLWFGITLMHVGLFDQTIEHLRMALEIDPNVPINYGMLGWAEYLSGQDSIGYVHLSEGVNMGWNAGIQRLAYYHMEHGDWNKAEFYLEEHASKSPMSIDLDYHALISALQKKDVAQTRKILDSITSNRGFMPGFKMMLYCLVGDYERSISNVSNWGIAEAMRPSRSALRNHPSCRKYLVENGVPGIWKKYGWPSVCSPVGDDDFRCE